MILRKARRINNKAQLTMGSRKVKAAAKIKAINKIKVKAKIRILTKAKLIAALIPRRMKKTTSKLCNKTKRIKQISSHRTRVTQYLRQPKHKRLLRKTLITTLKKPQRKYLVNPCRAILICENLSKSRVLATRANC